MADHVAICLFCNGSVEVSVEKFLFRIDFCCMELYIKVLLFVVFPSWEEEQTGNYGANNEMCSETM